MREMVNARNENFAKIGFLLQTKHRGQESKLLAQLPHDQVIVISISISIFIIDNVCHKQPTFQGFG